MTGVGVWELAKVLAKAAGWELHHLNSVAARSFENQAEAILAEFEVRPHGTVTDTEDIDALIAETRAFLAERPMGPPIYHRIGKLVAALEAAREDRS